RPARLFSPTRPIIHAWHEKGPRFPRLGALPARFSPSVGHAASVPGELGTLAACPTEGPAAAAPPGPGRRSAAAAPSPVPPPPAAGPAPAATAGRPAAAPGAASSARTAS